jgi:2-dehydro-3-deoxyphosphogluconate aldolase / (4S)-4-hydroxy-2-oxoglutarate aldolase
MNAADAAARLQADRLLAIIRTESAADARVAAEGLIAGGIASLEISLTTPGALQAIAHLAAEAALGAGTIRGVADAEASVDAGAAFLLSPHTDLQVAAWARAHDVLYIPGALTPTDVAAALDAGSTLIKLFPARAFGPAYVRDLLGPFPTARLVPTGGIDAANAREYLDAGAVAVAMGSSLVNADTIADRARLATLAEQARAAVTPSTTNPEST